MDHTHLNLTYLKFFHDAALLDSVSESARRNFVTQSAVSQGIRKLERSLGAALCHHKKQQFKLTDLGHIVFEQSRAVFGSVRGLCDAVARFEGTPRGAMQFVCTHSLALSLLPKRLTSFREECPDVEPRMLLGGLSQIHAWLKQGTAEFGFVIDGPAYARFERHVVFEGSFELVENTRQPGDKAVDGVWVEHADGLHVPSFISESQFPVRGELNSWELIARCIDVAGGVGYLPTHVLEGNRYPDLRVVKGEWSSVPYRVVALFRQGESPGFASQQFLHRARW